MSPTPVATPVSPTLRRRRGMTEEAAIAAVDQACRRLRLPTIRALVDEALYAVPYASHYDPRGLAVGDLDGNGRPDLALADYYSGLVVLRHT